MSAAKNKQLRDLGQGMEIVTVAADDPQILDKVQYVYTSYAQYMVTGSDVRIAFGDRIPPLGEVRPAVGIIMSHEQARSFAESAAKMLDAVEALKKLLEGEGPSA